MWHLLRIALHDQRLDSVDRDGIPAGQDETHVHPGRGVVPVATSVVRFRFKGWRWPVLDALQGVHHHEIRWPNAVVVANERAERLRGGVIDGIGPRGHPTRAIVGVGGRRELAHRGGSDAQVLHGTGNTRRHVGLHGRQADDYVCLDVTLVDPVLIATHARSLYERSGRLVCARAPLERDELIDGADVRLGVSEHGVCRGRGHRRSFHDQDLARAPDLRTHEIGHRPGHTPVGGDAVDCLIRGLPPVVVRVGSDQVGL